MPARPGLRGDAGHAEGRPDRRWKSNIDPAGLTLLLDLIGRGATIAGCSGFIEELLGEGRPRRWGTVIEHARLRPRTFRTFGPV